MSRRQADTLFALESSHENSVHDIQGHAMQNVTLNLEQKLYVIAVDTGYSCVGFDNARDHTNQIAERLGQPELAFAPGDHGTLDGYRKHGQAVQAWARSDLSRRTYFDPGTAPELAGVLEGCRKSNRKVRLVLGDPDTGEAWLDEYDVVGTIGRSAGSLKVPLLIEDGESGGGAVLTACVLAVIDWQSGRWLFRHAAYKHLDLDIRATGDAARPWVVSRSQQAVACFQDIGKAGAYVAFMRGETVEPRVFR